MDNLLKLKEKLASYQRMHLFVIIKEYFIFTIATFPYALVLNQIIVPHNLVGGGISGLSTIIFFFSNRLVPIWLSNIILNVILLAIALKIIGWKACVRSIYGILVLSFWYWLIPVADKPLITDPFMAVILSGIFAGMALGTIFLNNGSTGGTDLIALMVSKYRYISMGNVLLACDIIIICSGYFLPNVHSVEKILFGLTYTFMSRTAIDTVMKRVRQSVQFFIFSKKAEEVSQAIITKLHRGVTQLEGIGGYTHQPMKVLTILCRRNEASTVFQLVRHIDPDAFIAENQVEGVFGQGFDSIRKMG